MNWIKRINSIFSTAAENLLCADSCVYSKVFKVERHTHKGWKSHSRSTTLTNQLCINLIPALDSIIFSRIGTTYLETKKWIGFVRWSMSQMQIAVETGAGAEMKHLNSKQAAAIIFSPSPRWIFSLLSRLQCTYIFE